MAFRVAGVLMFALLASLASLWLLDSIEVKWGLSALYSIRGTRPEPSQVSVIALNVHTAEQLGVPPRPGRWPRSLHAELIDGLHAVGAQVVAFDLLFDRARESVNDQLLTRALHRAGNVVLVRYLRRDQVPTTKAVAVVDYPIAPLPEFEQAALASAPFVLLKTPDGTIDYLAFAPEDSDSPSLPVVLASAMEPAALRHLLSAGRVDKEEPLHLQLESLRRFARLDAQGFAAVLKDVDASSKVHWPRLFSTSDARVALNLYGPPGHIDTIPYDRALGWFRSAAPEANRLRRRAVLVGSSEFNQPEQRDAYPTPWSSEQGLDFGGTELAATALANQLDGSALQRLSDGQQVGLMSLLSALFLLPWVSSCKPKHAIVASAMAAAAYAVTASLAFSRAYLWLPFALPLFVIFPSATIVGLAIRYREVERQRQRLRAALDRYAPDDAIAQLANQMQGHDRTVNVVCMSSDIEDYTRRVENRDPTEARDWINTYFERVFPIVRAHGGYVIDHAGDSMVCIWLSGSDAEGACKAAADAAKAVHALCNVQQQQSTGFDVNAWPTRIGLHFGPVAIGDVGDTVHAERRVVGDIVNTASRIQAANKALGTRILVSDLVAERLSAQSVRPLGHFMLQGKAQSVGLVDPIPVNAELCAWYAKALAALEQGSLGEARNAVERLLTQFPDDGPGRYLLSRLHEPVPFNLSLK